jgi:HSP20 family molecular chaperone IbpA
VDVEKVEAKVKNGVLEVRLPKSEEAKSRRVEVKP